MVAFTEVECWREEDVKRDLEHTTFGHGQKLWVHQPNFTPKTARQRKSWLDKMALISVRYEGKKTFGGQADSF